MQAKWGVFQPELGRRAIRLMILLPWLALLTTGCFQYDLGIRFDHQTHGQIVQRISVGERAAALSEPTLVNWLTDLQRRTQALGGTVQSKPGGQWDLRLPFYNGADLVRRFNQLFDPDQQGLSVPTLGQVTAHLDLEQKNWVVAIRNHLTYTLDLRELPPEAPLGAAQERTDWLDFYFSLETPWGIRTLNPDSPPPEQAGPTTRWRLLPGDAYRIDLVFWVPSWLGLGGGLIALLVLLGYFLKYGLKYGLRPRVQPRSP